MQKRSKIVSFEDAKSRAIGRGRASSDFDAYPYSSGSFNSVDLDDPSIRSEVSYRNSGPVSSSVSSRPNARRTSNKNLSYVFEVDFASDGTDSVFADDSFDNPNLGIDGADIDGMEEEIASYSENKLSFFAKRDQKKRQRNKERAAKAYKRSLGSSQISSSDSDGPRAALYEAKMGSRQKRANRLQNSQDASGRGSGFSIPHIGLPNISHRLTATICVLVCIVLFVGMLYTPAQQYYQQMRERDRLTAEYEAIIDRNDSLQSLVDNLQSEEGIEDKAHAEFGLVKSGEEAGAVTGIDVTSESKFKANIAPGSISAPETWYSAVLDVIFLYGY